MSLTIPTLPASDHALVCHSASPSGLDLRLSVALEKVGSGASPALLLRYEVRGPVEALLLPDLQTPGPADQLWQHTCFEAFVGAPGSMAYREFNFSPSRQWAAYLFSTERVRDEAAEAKAPPVQIGIECSRAPGVLVLQACLPAHALPLAPEGQALNWGLSAVLQTTDSQLSYWALHHPAPRPDFHHPAGRILALNHHSLPASTAP